MNEDQVPEVHEFFHGQTDELAVQEYLNVNDDGEIARLAAMMAPKAKTFDPVALVDAAIALQRETKAGLVRRRESLAASMNHDTLLELQTKLGRALSLIVDDDDDGLRDPVVGPVLQRLRSTVSDAFKRGEEHDKALMVSDTTARLAKADARTTLPRPSLPCDLEEVLRFAANAPSVPWEILEKAFIVCLDFSNQTQLANHEEGFQQKCREDYSETLAALGENADDGPHRNGLKAAVARCETSLAEMQSARIGRENFVPSQETPAGISEAAAINYAKYFQNPGCVKDAETLALLSTEFHAFWEKHGDAYLSVDAAAEKARKAKAEKNRKAAPKGSASRERTRWLKQTEKFVAFSNANQPSASDRSELIKIFADRHTALRSKAAKIKVQEFLGMLSSYEGREFDRPAMLEILRKSGIKAMTEDAVRECLMLLKSAPGKEIEKSRKKLFGPPAASFGEKAHRERLPLRD